MDTASQWAEESLAAFMRKTDTTCIRNANGVLDYTYPTKRMLGTLSMHCLT
jgi:hypothetical protein